MESWIDVNRANWENRVAVHVNSTFYDVEGWLRDAPGPRRRELDALGDLAGLSLVHLQCHFGLDTLQWARVGATVTGVDFSPAAIREASALAKRAGLADRARFVCANVYDAASALVGERFDVVYVSLGALCWLPDLVAWGEVVARLLAPGGRLYLHEAHPFSFVFDDAGERVTYDYFCPPEKPLVMDEPFTYTDGPALTATRNFQWNHPLGDVVGSLVNQGLTLTSLVEHDWTDFQQFPWLTPNAEGRPAIPPGHASIPLSFTLTARAPG